MHAYLSSDNGLLESFVNIWLLEGEMRSSLPYYYDHNARVPSLRLHLPGGELFRGDRPEPRKLQCFTPSTSSMIPSQPLVPIYHLLESSAHLSGLKHWP